MKYILCLPEFWRPSLQVHGLLLIVYLIAASYSASQGGTFHFFYHCVKLPGQVQLNLESPNTNILVSMLTRVGNSISAYLSTKETRSISTIVPAGVSSPIFASLKSTFVILDFFCFLACANHQTTFFHNQCIE